MAALHALIHKQATEYQALNISSIYGFIQLTFPGSQTQQQVETYPNIYSINYLEPKVVFLAPKEFQELCSNKILLIVKSDTPVLSATVLLLVRD